MATNNKLEKIKGDHCRDCGSTDFDTDRDGYTTCCNKSVCSGSYSEAFNHEGGRSVKACCWAGAAIEWQNKYGEPLPNGSYSF